MKTSNIGLENLLDQLSEEKINLVVDNIAVEAGWETCSGHSGSSKSSKSKSSKSNKSNKSCKSH